MNGSRALKSLLSLTNSIIFGNRNPMCFFNKHFSLWQRYNFHKHSKNNLWTLPAALKYEILNSMGHCFLLQPDVDKRQRVFYCCCFKKQRKVCTKVHPLSSKQVANMWLESHQLPFQTMKLWKRNILNLNILSAANKVRYDFKLDLGKHTGKLQPWCWAAH